MNPRLLQLLHIFAQLDVPIGQVNEMLPTVVLVQAEVDLHEWPPFRTLGLADKVQAASCGVRLAFCVLHSTQEQTMFPTLSVRRGRAG